MNTRVILSIALALITLGKSAIPSSATSPVRGTIVVAVPVRDGLVVCADKRLFNVQSATFTDTNIKIRKVSNSALFVATNTVGFYDNRSRTMSFDAFEITEKFVASHQLSEGKRFWDGLKK